MGCLSVTTYGDNLVLWLTPNINGRVDDLTSAKRKTVELVNDVHTKGWHDVFLKVLVLVVPPNEDEIGMEGIQFRTESTETVHHELAVLPGRGQTFVVSPLQPHRFRPVTYIL